MHLSFKLRSRTNEENGAEERKQVAAKANRVIGQVTQLLPGAVRSHTLPAKNAHFYSTWYLECITEKRKKHKVTRMGAQMNTHIARNLILHPTPPKRLKAPLNEKYIFQVFILCVCINCSFILGYMPNVCQKLVVSFPVKQIKCFMTLTALIYKNWSNHMWLRASSHTGH